MVWGTDKKTTKSRLAQVLLAHSRWRLSLDFHTLRSLLASAHCASPGCRAVGQHPVHLSFQHLPPSELESAGRAGPMFGTCSEIFMHAMGFHGGSDSKESSCNTGDLDSNLGSGRSPEGGNGNPPQYSCLENSMDR